MRIIVKEKGKAAQSIRLQGDSLTFGRSRKADVQLGSSFASGKHCVLTFDGDTLAVQDLGSTNGTFLNGQKIQTAPVRPGDRLLVGTALVLVTADDEPPDLQQLALQYEEGDADTREQVVGMLGALGSPHAVDLLRDALADSEAAVREAAASSIGTMGAPGAGEELVACLSDPEPGVRRRAKWALVRTGDSTATEALVRTIAEGEPEACQAAIHISGMLRLRGTVPTIIGALGAEQFRTREAAVRALGDLGDSAALPHLLSALGQPERYPTAWVIHALTELGDAAAIPELVVHLGHEVVEVREAAAHALGSIWSPQSVTHLIGALHDADHRVRHTAAASLARIRRSLKAGKDPKTSASQTLHLSAFGDTEAAAHADESGMVQPLTIEEDVEYWEEWWAEAQQQLPPAQAGG